MSITTVPMRAVVGIPGAGRGADVIMTRGIMHDAANCSLKVVVWQKTMNIPLSRVRCHIVRPEAVTVFYLSVTLKYLTS